MVVQLLVLMVQVVSETGLELLLIRNQQGEVEIWVLDGDRKVRDVCLSEVDR